MNDAVAHEGVYRGTKISNIGGRDLLISALSAIIPRNLSVEDVVFVCIGTDRSTGDALGPICGMMLENSGYTNVYGTIDNPTHAGNLTEVIDRLPEGKTIIAVDASLGRLYDVGTYSVIHGSVKPGAGVNKYHLPNVGDYAITGCVNVSGFMEHEVLGCTRLSVVYRMAADIAAALIAIFPREVDINENGRNHAKVHA